VRSRSPTNVSVDMRVSLPGLTSLLPVGAETSVSDGLTCPTWRTDNGIAGSPSDEVSVVPGTSLVEGIDLASRSGWSVADSATGRHVTNPFGTDPFDVNPVGTVDVNSFDVNPVGTVVTFNGTPWERRNETAVPPRACLEKTGLLPRAEPPRAGPLLPEPFPALTGFCPSYTDDALSMPFHAPPFCGDTSTSDALDTGGGMCTLDGAPPGPGTSAWGGSSSWSALLLPFRPSVSFVDGPTVTSTVDVLVTVFP
jgi:hypothetical protein